MKQEAVTFTCGQLTLEGAWHWPQGEGTWSAVVICHPHPLYGGSMDNNIGWAIAKSLPPQGIACFRFNFRGVGRSQGRFADGAGEQDDLRAALAFVTSHERVDSHRLGVAGYSFGANVAISVAPTEGQIQVLALVSPPITPPMFPPGLEPLLHFPRPKLIISGGQDLFINHQELERQVKRLPPPAEFAIIPGADHFWWGYEKEAEARVGSFFAQHL